jgi:hypothetical protein
MREDIEPYTLCDMINDPIPCPKRTPKPFRKSSIQICSRRNRRIYNILLEKEMTIDINQESYEVVHVEPI